MRSILFTSAKDTSAKVDVHLTGKGQFHSATEMTRKIKTLDYW